MGRSPKSSSHQKHKRRKDSSSSESDDDRERYEKRNRDRSREDHRSRSSKIFKNNQECKTLLFLLDVRVKQEPISDAEHHHSHQKKSYEPRPANRRNTREQDEKGYQWGKQTDREKPKEAPVEKEKPNFSVSGALLKDTNTYKGVVIKYSEPIEARKPKRRWRLYVFKGEQVKRNFCRFSSY